MMRKGYVVLAMLLIILCTARIQGQSIGIRAGLNMSKFLGPTEAAEKLDFSNGFHFGINYGYKFTPDFMLRAELLYTQQGTVQSYDGSSYYKIYPGGTASTIFEKGKLTKNVNISTAYISIPIVAAYKVLPKIEISAGLAASFLVNPIGQGTQRFVSSDNPEGIIFRQSLDYDYFRDEALGGRFTNRNIQIIVAEDIITLPRFAGAYYQYNEIQKPQDLYKWFDVSLTGGLNYFINKGFFIGVHAFYGLRDISNNDVDISLESLDADNKFIYRADKDINLSLQASVGFRF